MLLILIYNIILEDLADITNISDHFILHFKGLVFTAKAFLALLLEEPQDSPMVHRLPRNLFGSPFSH